MEERQRRNAPHALEVERCRASGGLIRIAWLLRYASPTTAAGATTLRRSLEPSSPLAAMALMEAALKAALLATEAQPLVCSAELGKLGFHLLLSKVVMGTWPEPRPSSSSDQQESEEEEAKVEELRELAAAVMAACSCCCGSAAEFPAKPAIGVVQTLDRVFVTAARLAVGSLLAEEDSSCSSLSDALDRCCCCEASRALASLLLLSVEDTKRTLPSTASSSATYPPTASSSFSTLQRERERQREGEREESHYTTETWRSVLYNIGATGRGAMLVNELEKEQEEEKGACPSCGHRGNQWGGILAEEVRYARALREDKVVPALPFQFELKPITTSTIDNKEKQTNSDVEEYGEVDQWAKNVVTRSSSAFLQSEEKWKLYVRPLAMRLESHKDVGAVLWPAAPVMARWLMHHPQLLLGKSVLEIASGLGLAGLAAGCLCRSITVSDFHPAVLRNLTSNLALNRGRIRFPHLDDVADGDDDPIKGEVERGSNVSTIKPALLSSATASVAWLDFLAVSPPPEEKTKSKEGDCLDDGSSMQLYGPPEGFGDASQQVYDVIIGTDMVINEADCEGVARVCRRCLAPSSSTSASIALFMLAPSDVRYGTSLLRPALERHGFFVLQQTVNPSVVFSDDAEDEASETTIGGGYEARLQLFAVSRHPFTSASTGSAFNSVDTD
ncbi:Nicotinamide N-methyltransferase-like [Balamuthia mandrillaris]